MEKSNSINYGHGGHLLGGRGSAAHGHGQVAAVLGCWSSGIRDLLSKKGRGIQQGPKSR